MNRYSRVFHHISLDDVKRNKVKAEEKQKDFLKSIREARNFLRDLNSPHYSDWRNNLVKEGMNTSNVFQTTFPSTGESNLENIDANNADAYTAAGGQDALNGTSIKASGSGTGSDGGFDLGQSYLAFDGEAISRHAILDPIDSSKFDTMVINAIVGNDSNGGEDPDVAGEELRLYYLEPGGSSFKSISINPSGDLTNNDDILIDLGAGNGSLQQFSINLPSYARGEGFTYMLYQLTNSGTEFDHYGITNIKYQRRNPITLFVSLDSPEAVSFINDGSGGLSPAEKKKRLEDMLAASDEYMDTMFPTNQEAMKRAEENLKRNIEISLDPNTFKFPEYGTPTYNQMFGTAYIEADSDTAEIDRYLEQQGLTLDNLESAVVKGKGEFKMGREVTLTLLNNPDTQERALTALGIDPGLVNNLTPDSFDKIGKITNLRPGGTPATGWDGKFYELNDSRLEASRVIPLETYLQVKGTDNYAGVERPDKAEPYMRYVMEKPYSFSQDSEARPVYASVRNEDIEKRIPITLVGDATKGLGYGVSGHSATYSLYKKESGESKLFYLRKLVESATKTLNFIEQNASSLAFSFLYDNNRYSGIYTDRVERYKDTDLSTEYNPLYMWDDQNNQEMLRLLRGISNPRSLDYSMSYHIPSTDDYATRQSKHARHQSENDRLYANLQKALGRVDSIKSIDPFVKDEWFLRKDSDAGTVTEIRTTHPYSQLSTTPSPQDQEKPDDSFMDIQVGDERIIKSGNETVLDTMRGIDNRQKNSIEKELDRIKKMPPDVRGELTRLLSVAGTSEYTPTSPKTKKEIEDYWASLPPEKISDIEGRTQASGVDAFGLGIAALAGLALGAAGAGAALTSAVSSGISKIKNLAKPKPTPSNVRYPSNMRTPGSPGKPTSKGADFGRRMRQQVAQEYGTTTSQQGGKVIRTRPTPQRGYNPGGNTSLRNSYEPQGDSLMDNYEPKAKHNEKITKHPKIKSPKEFFKRADIKPVYPDTPPPEMINGRHPDLVDGLKVSDRFNRLDPTSAKAMPPTGNPHIDKKVRAAAKKPK